MKIVIEYEVDNTDGYYNVPAEVAAELILEAETNQTPIHGFKNVKISIYEQIH